jgi:hypothetical protein
VILNIILGIWASCLTVAIVIYFRNEQVFRFRMKTIDFIFKQPDWERRRDIFTSVSYEEMVWKFWKRPEDFYDDKSFLE